MSKASFRNSRPKVLPQEGAPERRSKLTGEHPCGSVIQTELLCNCIEITRPHERSPANPPHLPKTPHHKNTSAGMPLFAYPKLIIRIIQQILSYAGNFCKFDMDSF